MTQTKEWAEALGINTQDILPPSEDINESYWRTSGEAATRILLLHSIVAAGSGMDRKAVNAWLQDQNLWEHASPHEKALLLSPRILKEEKSEAQWLQEAQWALLWTISRVEALGLPTKRCNNKTLVNEIMPAPGDSIDEFISTAEFRPAAEINAENDRISRLYFNCRQAADKGKLPEDLIYEVLANRYRAFRWLTSDEQWDEVNMESIPE
ncbi:MAG: DUF4272 domain-containing protein [Deltaproteobacteria bacterium]|nr:DUF4272 domain-containing protein [Deltaproteobacteria bacterium]